MAGRGQSRSGGALRAELAAYLLAARKNTYVDGSPMTRKQAAAALRRQKISEYGLVRIEGAITRIRTKSVLEAMLDLYEVEDAQREQLCELWARDRSTEDWITAYRPVMSAGMTTYVGLEAQADEIKLYHPATVHGLFQTERYARTVYENGQRVHDVRMKFIKSHVELRRERKRRVFQRQPRPVQIRAVLSEAALRTMVGNESIMREQWEEIAMLSRLPHVQIQVLPLWSGGRMHREYNDFAILTLAPPLRPHIQVDMPWGAVSTSDKETEVQRFARAFAEMSSYALAPEETPEYLHQLSKEIDTS
ncbi:DUF5753 domain-containing protein [Streptomyces sp. NPDC047046]|uniref:DUF5753 domain-containing protein n=1 Tax=Streptomyces sp. NPDC047046 TaxID=3155378 RepID=UPI0033F297A2